MKTDSIYRMHYTFFQPKATVFYFQAVKKTRADIKSLFKITDFQQMAHMLSLHRIIAGSCMPRRQFCEIRAMGPAFLLSIIAARCKRTSGGKVHDVGYH